MINVLCLNRCATPKRSQMLRCNFSSVRLLPISVAWIPTTCRLNQTVQATAELFFVHIWNGEDNYDKSCRSPCHHKGKLICHFIVSFHFLYNVIFHVLYKGAAGCGIFGGGGRPPPRPPSRPLPPQPPPQPPPPSPPPPLPPQVSKKAPSCLLDGPERLTCLSWSERGPLYFLRGGLLY